jgi:hypothetical protein
MIPYYLIGKSAAQIIGEVRRNFAYDNDKNVAVIDEKYIVYLEGLLLIAVKDALMNAEEVKELVQEGEYQAQQRAMGFLNMVLPKV